MVADLKVDWTVLAPCAFESDKGATTGGSTNRLFFWIHAVQPDTLEVREGVTSLPINKAWQDNALSDTSQMRVRLGKGTD